jgi:Ca2+-binding EF-hand superfamily protein
MKNQVALSVLSIALIVGMTACAPHPGGDRPERPSVDELFNKADSNRDGVLTKEELKAVMP